MSQTVWIQAVYMHIKQLNPDIIFHGVHPIYNEIDILILAIIKGSG